jgi:hypothetical protein
MKERVLQFVESKGSASYTDIIRFIVDYRNGNGTYDASNHSRVTIKRMYNKDGVIYATKIVGRNPYRGTYSGAFSGNTPYFLRSKNRLQKISNGKYIVIREQK